MCSFLTHTYRERERERERERLSRHCLKSYLVVLEVDFSCKLVLSFNKDWMPFGWLRFMTVALPMYLNYETDVLFTFIRILSF